MPPALPSPRSLLHPTNVRFGVMLLLLSLVTLLANTCAQSAVVRGILGSEAVSRLPSDFAAVRSDVASVRSAVDGVGGQVGALDAQVQRLLAMEHRVVYTHDPGKQAEPDPQALEQLRALTLSGATIRIVHRPVNAEGPVRAFDCADVLVDDNGGVLCTSPILAANLALPDGRRYQETVRHDGTLVLAHWDAAGTNVQGAQQFAAYATTWLARGPLR